MTDFHTSYRFLSWGVALLTGSQIMLHYDVNNAVLMTAYFLISLHCFFLVCVNLPRSLKPTKYRGTWIFLKKYRDHSSVGFLILRSQLLISSLMLHPVPASFNSFPSSYSRISNVLSLPYPKSENLSSPSWSSRFSSSNRLYPAALKTPSHRTT